jgi:hypothetical protein
MNENQIADIWILFKEYLDKKTIDLAAERYVDLLADNGISDKVLQSAIGYDEALDEAIEYYLDEDNEDNVCGASGSHSRGWLEQRIATRGLRSHSGCRAYRYGAYRAWECLYQRPIGSSGIGCSQTFDRWRMRFGA